jgi:cytoskeletal protein CcmA (bactofilin family)
VAVSGPVEISGSVAVSGPVEISGSVAVSGPVEISGSVAVSGPVEISGSVAVSGTVAVSGPIQISGSVAVSGPVEISGSVAVSGTVVVSGPIQISGSVAVSGPVEISGTVALSGHSIVDSGPLTNTINSGIAGSGALSGGSYDILSYTSWTLAVKYSGASGDQVTVILEKSALSGGVATDSDYVFDSSGNFSTGNWLLFTAGITPRYARLYYKDTGADSGVLLSYFQAQN